MMNRVRPPTCALPAPSQSLDVAEGPRDGTDGDATLAPDACAGGLWESVRKYTHWVRSVDSRILRETRDLKPRQRFLNETLRSTWLCAQIDAAGPLWAGAGDNQPTDSPELAGAEVFLRDEHVCSKVGDFTVLFLCKCVGCVPNWYPLLQAKKR